MTDPTIPHANDLAQQDENRAFHIHNLVDSLFTDQICHHLRGKRVSYDLELHLLTSPKTWTEFFFPPWKLKYCDEFVQVIKALEAKGFRVKITRRFASGIYTGDKHRRLRHRLEISYEHLMPERVFCDFDDIPPASSLA